MAAGQMSEEPVEPRDGPDREASRHAVRRRGGLPRGRA
jgi:hypothetical protein